MFYIIKNIEVVLYLMYGEEAMTEKKNAINISLGIILLCLIVTIICWSGKDSGLAEILFVFSTGIFCSSFATLWIFVYEYNREKKIVLTSIFNKVYYVMENGIYIPSMARHGFYDSEVRKYLEGKYYMPPMREQLVLQMEQSERCLYEICRFVDGILEIGYEKINDVHRTIEAVDFWTDSFRKKLKRRDIILKRISMPIYEVFVFEAAMEEGYIFRYFTQFKNNYLYSADEICFIVEKLDIALYGSNGEISYSWLKQGNIRGYMHEKLWIFRDAFFMQEMTRAERKKAMKAFIYDEEYYWIR